MVDDRDAEFLGKWSRSTANRKFVDSGYRHNDNQPNDATLARFTLKLVPGRYEVRISYPPNGNRASNVPVTIKHAAGSSKVTISQRKEPAIDGLYVSVGEYSFDERGEVTIGTEGTDGYVIVDSVQFLSVAP